MQGECLESFIIVLVRDYDVWMGVVMVGLYRTGRFEKYLGLVGIGD